MDHAWSAAHANFLSSLSDVELSALSAHARTLSIRKREIVFRAGDTAHDIYVVTGGSVRLYQYSPAGKQIILWLSFPGELFGLSETMRSTQREIFAEASEDSELLVLSQADFLEFLRVHPEAALRALDILSARVRTLGSSLVDLATDDVETRLIRLLLRFSTGTLPRACGAETSGEEICLNLSVTHNDIGNLIGASRQTITTTLAKFRRRGLINLIDRHIHVTDPDRLRAMLEPV